MTIDDLSALITRLKAEGATGQEEVRVLMYGGFVGSMRLNWIDPERAMFVTIPTPRKEPCGPAGTPARWFS